MTKFADTFHEHIRVLEESDKLSKTGTGRFDPLIADIAEYLGVSTDEVYIVACARPNNFNIRLTQGKSQRRHSTLGLGVIPKSKSGTIKSALKAGSAFIGSGKAEYDAVGVVLQQNGR